MSIRQALKLAQYVEAEAVIDVPVGTAATSEGHLAELDPVAAAAFGINTETTRVTRDQAMQVPTIRRGRALIAGTIGTLPLVAYRQGQNGSISRVERQLLQLDSRTTPAATLTWIADDLMFHPCSWVRVRDRDATGYPSDVERIGPWRVTVDMHAGRVRIDGELVNDADLIRIDGPDEGILKYGGPAIRLAIALQKAAQRTADDDWSGLILRLAEGAPELGDTAIIELLNAWDTARRERSTAFLNRAVDPEKISVSAQDRQLAELWDVCSSELARLMNLPASRVGAPQGSGMTYANTEADRRDLVDTTLAQYLTPIYQRLSMGDVTPRGQRVAFDLTSYLRGDTASLVAAGVQAIDAGIADAAEVRTDWLGLPPRAQENNA